MRGPTRFRVENNGQNFLHKTVVNFTEVCMQHAVRDKGSNHDWNWLFCWASKMLDALHRRSRSTAGLIGRFELVDNAGKFMTVGLNVIDTL